MKCVHTEHCCRNCGCKYNDHCPVWLGYKVQSYPCEGCYDIWNPDAVIPKVKDLPKPTFEEYRLRRLESGSTR